MTDSRGNSSEPLSPAGEARRERMLAELLGEMSAARRRKRTRRGVISTLALALLLFTYLRYVSFAPIAPTDRVERMAGTTAQQTLRTGVVFVSTDESSLQRMRPDPRPIVVQIDDRELLQTLVEIGRPAGIIRIGDRLALSAPVTDDELSSTRRDH